MSTLIGKIEPGDVVGRCRIIRELGRGGVGTVYLATHQTLQIEVALKILSPSLSLDNPALAERFIREAQFAARIRHPNVIAVMDAAHDEPTGLYFIVLEYVGGGSLSWHLRNGPLAEAKALGIVTGIAHALVIAEENQIVHRDIKPDNIMLDKRGVAKLADLGLAKHAIDSHTSLTLGGSFMGTPAYMSPEQARDAKATDTRDDIYSLGATLYECLTGRAPFQGETPYNIMSELLTKPSPQPRAARPELSRSIDLICGKMMAKSREARYADAHALVRDLQHAQMYGDARLDELEACASAPEPMDEVQPLDYGVHTSAEGVAGLSDSMNEPPPARPDTRPPARPASPPKSVFVPERARGPYPPRGGDQGVFRAAALLLALVTAATLLLTLSTSSPFVHLRGQLLALVQGSSAAAPSATSVSNPAVPVSPSVTVVTPSSAPQPSSPQHPPVDAPPTLAPTAPAVVPVAVPTPPPLDGATNGIPVAVPALPVDTNGAPIPATPVVMAPDSAFEARSIAESTLPPGTTGPTGEAALLKMVGKRDDSVVTPTAWTFYFYDTSATGNARIVTVRNRNVKSSEDLGAAISPWHTEHILPDDKLQIDSTQALQIAAGLVPGVTVTASEFEIVREKNSVPMWKVTLWARDRDGKEKEVGTVSMLTENGQVISNSLKPDRLTGRE